MKKGNLYGKNFRISRKENGITLIALVITIVVLLILAGISINAVIGENGILDKAKDSKEKTAIGNYEDIIKLSIADFYLDNVYNDLSNDEKIEKMIDKLEENQNLKNASIDNEDTYIIVTTNEGYEFMVDVNTSTEYIGKFQSEDGTDTKIIRRGNNISGDENGTITGGKYSYSNPVIPVGFKKVETENASWKSEDGITVKGYDKGLVITDIDGNQFVWVPIDNVKVKYEKNTNGKTAVSANNTVTDTLPSEITEESAQIKKYGGFYVARFEAGIPEEKIDEMSSLDSRNKKYKPISKLNSIPWTSINYENSKINAESMYNTGFVQSGLITGTQWDTICAWLNQTGVDVYSQSNLWGNYIDSYEENVTEYSEDNGVTWKRADSAVNEQGAWLIKTGNSEYSMRNNICDFAGNVWEWNSEKENGTGKYILRGGGYGNYYTYNPAIYRYSRVNTDVLSDLGFRCVLYIK